VKYKEELRELGVRTAPTWKYIDNEVDRRPAYTTLEDRRDADEVKDSKAGAHLGVHGADDGLRLGDERVASSG
jgi:hypothetical protein